MHHMVYSSGLIFYPTSDGQVVGNTCASDQGKAGKYAVQSDAKINFRSVLTTYKLTLQ